MMGGKHRQTSRKRLQCSGVSKVLVVGNFVVVFSLATALWAFFAVGVRHMNVVAHAVLMLLQVRGRGSTKFSGLELRVCL